MPERATLNIAITRSDTTAQAAANKLEKANIRFVLALRPQVRNATPAPIGAGIKFTVDEYDFYVRDAETGAILMNANGKERIRAAALENAVQRLMANYHREVVGRQIRAEGLATLEANTAAALAADTD